MRADVVRWEDLAERPEAELEGLRVLLDGGLVTIRSLGRKLPGGRKMHRLSYDTPWGNFENTVVNGAFFTAVIIDVLGSGTMDQEERQ